MPIDNDSWFCDVARAFELWYVSFGRLDILHHVTVFSFLGCHANDFRMFLVPLGIKLELDLRGEYINHFNQAERGEIGMPMLRREAAMRQ